MIVSNKMHGFKYKAIQWTGNNLKEVIEFIGRHPSVKDLPWPEYENLVAEKGFKLFVKKNLKIMVKNNAYIIKNPDYEIVVVDEDIFNKHFTIVGV